MKKNREGWRDESGYSESRGGTSLIPENLCNVSGSERLNYTFIMDRANECMYRLICESISMLLTEMSHNTVPKADMPKMASNWGRGLPIGTT